MALADDDWHEDGLASYQEALEIFRELDDPGGQAATLTSIGIGLSRSGHHGDAAAFHRQALAIHQRIHGRYGQTLSPDGLDTRSGVWGGRPRWPCCRTACPRQGSTRGRRTGRTSSGLRPLAGHR
ncbi:tetratricopeptide repeat protein [Streptosporangium canum]|uniref:tetratricopeptide repeat protein n=1 Tax=Streptosporangium canum TaxID=324952 RepID=UPI0037BA2A82